MAHLTEGFFFDRLATNSILAVGPLTIAVASHRSISFLSPPNGQPIHSEGLYGPRWTCYSEIHTPDHLLAMTFQHKRLICLFANESTFYISDETASTSIPLIKASQRTRSTIASLSRSGTHAAICWANIIGVWSTLDGSQLGRLAIDPTSVHPRAIHCTPLVVTALIGNSLLKFDVGHSVTSMKPPPGCTSITADLNSEQIALGCRNGCVYVIRKQQQERRARKLLGHTCAVAAVAFNPLGGGQRLASLGEDGRVRLWDLRGSGEFPPCVVLATMHDAFVADSLEWGDDGKTLVVSGPNGIRAWIDCSSVATPASLQCMAMWAIPGEAGGLPTELERMLKGHQERYAVF